MRRRPIATYRVIDEAELLGADAPEVPAAVPRPAAFDSMSRGLAEPWRRGRRTSWSGWVATTLAVGVLAAVAALLLHAGRPAHALLAAPARPSRQAELWREPAAAAAAPRQVLPVRQRPRARARAARRPRRRRVAGAATQRTAPDAPRSPAGQPAGPPAAVEPANAAVAAAGEFGFER